MSESLDHGRSGGSLRQIVESHTRYFAARSTLQTRVGARRVLRLLAQPPEGFSSPTEVLGWLIERDLVKRVLDRASEDGYRLEGWGDPYYAVAGWRGDPWEEEGDG